MNSPDYERGYDQALAEAAASVQAMDRKLTDAKRVIHALVVSAGGEIFVSRNAMSPTDNDVLTQSEDLARDGWTFSVRRK